MYPPATCVDVYQRLISVLFSTCHHDTSTVLTNSTEITCCFEKILEEHSGQNPVSSHLSSQQGEALPAVSLGNHACLVDHSNPPLGKQTATPNSTIQMAPRHLLGKSEETVEPGLLHLTSVVHSQITNFN